MYFSMRIGGDSPDNKRLRLAIQELNSIIEEVAPPATSADLQVDLTFDIPGPYSAPDYQGMRTGSFFRKKHILVVQVATPRQIDPAEIPNYLTTVLEETIPMVQGFAKRRNVTLSLENFIRAVGAIVSRVSKRS
jgi:hypothetical protein